MAEQNKYLDLTGTTELVAKIKAEDAKRVDKSPDTSAHTPSLYKVGTNAQGLVENDDLVAVSASDLAPLVQTVQGNGTAFGATDAVNIVGGGDATVAGDATNKKITVTAYNQMIKGNGTAFGASDDIDIVPGGNISVTADASNKKITIAYTGAAGNDNQKVKAGSVTFGDNDVVNYVAGDKITVTGDATNKSITIAHDATATAKSAGAFKVGSDKYGHVEIGSALQYTDIGGLPTIGDAVLTIKAGGNQKGTFSANATSDVAVNITAADLGLDAAIKFIGISTTDPKSTSGATVSGHSTWAKGEVVLYKRSGEAHYEEYINITGNNTSTATPNPNWELLGDADDYALKSIQIIAGDCLTGGGTLAQDVTLNHASTTEISAAPLKIGRDQYGHVTNGGAIIVDSAGGHTHTVSGHVTVPTVTPTSKKLSISLTPSTTSVVPSYTAEKSKLVTKSIIPAKTAAYSATYVETNGTKDVAKVGTAVNYGTANVGSKDYTVAACKSSGTSVASGAVSAVSAPVSGTKYAYDAAYDSTTKELVLTPLSLNTKSIQEAAALTITVPIAVASTLTLTPAAAETVQLYKLTNFAVANVDTATTVADGTLSTTGAGSEVATSISGTTPINAYTGMTAKAVLGTSGDVTVVDTVTVSSTTTPLTDGSAANAGAHTHSLS